MGLNDDPIQTRHFYPRHHILTYIMLPSTDTVTFLCIVFDLLSSYELHLVGVYTVVYSYHPADT